MKGAPAGHVALTAEMAKCLAEIKMNAPENASYILV